MAGVARAPRAGARAWPYLDIDGFKAVNETRGHLSSATALLPRSSRGCLPGRRQPAPANSALIGGDEFAVLLPGMDDPARPPLIELVRGRDRQRHRRRSRRRTTVSRRHLHARLPARDADHARAASADGALYWAKAPWPRPLLSALRPGRLSKELSAAERAAPAGARPGAVRPCAPWRLPLDALAPPSTRATPSASLRWPRSSPSSSGGSPAACAALARRRACCTTSASSPISDAVLFKPGLLDPVEYEQVKAHAALGRARSRDLLDPPSRSLRALPTTSARTGAATPTGSSRAARSRTARRSSASPTPTTR